MPSRVRTSAFNGRETCGTQTLQQYLKRSLVATAMLLSVSIFAADAPPPATAVGAFNEGQKVEVREGDSWSSASIVKKEGRKLLVHYDGTEASSDEWLSADRLRLPMTKAATSKPAPVKLFSAGDKIEFKEALSWTKGTVANTRGKWYMIQRDGSRDREWVEPWRVRKVGSTDDNIGWADGYGSSRNGGAPPREDPGESPLAGESTKDALKRQEREKFSAAAPLTPADRTAMVEIPFTADPGTPFIPDPEPKPARPLVTRPTLLAGAPENFFEHDEEIFFSGADALIATVTHVLNEASSIERIDVAAGHSLNTIPLPQETKALDLSPDGKLLITRTARFGFGNNERLDVWNIEGASLKQVVSFGPYGHLQNGERDVQSAKFIGSDRILTSNSEGRLVLWDYKAKAQWTMITPQRGAVSLSPGRKQLAALTGPTVSVIDSRTGKTLRVINTSLQFSNSLCFKPNGSQIAMASQDLLLVYDLVSGTLAHEFNPPLRAIDTLEWVSDGYILAGSTELVGLEEQMIVWGYGKAFSKKAQEAVKAGGPLRRPSPVKGVYALGRYWYSAPPLAMGKGKPVLVNVALPDDRARAALAKTDFAGQMVIHPGISVSLEVNLPDKMKADITKALTTALTANGIAVAEGQPIKLSAVSETGEAKQIMYAKGMFFPRFGPPPADATTVNYNELINRIAFVDAQGQKLWERRTIVSPPGSLRLKENQSIQDAVNESLQPSLFFFTQTRIPKLIPNASTHSGFGLSQLTAQGVVPGESQP